MKSTRRTALIFVWFAALLASSPANAADIHAAVSAAAQAGTLTRVLVILTAQADLSGAKAIQNRKGKGADVFGKLRASAAQTQGPVVAHIRGLGLAATPFFIMNAIYVEARPGTWITPQQLEALGAQPGVARISSAEVQADRPVEKKTLTAHDAASYSGPQPNIVQVGAPTLWAQGYSGQGVVIGFIDTGEDATFPDIATKYRGYAGAGQPTSDNYNFFDPSDMPCPNPLTGNPMPCDTDGHGTFVTGTAVGSNPAFQIGVAPAAQWVGCRAITTDGTVSDILTCLQWMLAPTDVLGNNPDPTQAPDIVNNSYFCQGCDIDYAFTSLRSAGIVPVAAVGNYGPYCLSAVEPGGYPDVVGVGAVFANGTITDFSSRGPYVDYNDNLWAKPDVTAPGAAIVSALANTTGYTEMSGTSMSSPHVAGQIALLLSANPSLDFLSVSGTTPQPADISQLLGGVTGGANATLNTSCDLYGPTGNVYGAGTINVPNALQVVLKANPLLVTSTDTAELPAGAALSIPVAATGGAPPYRWALTGPGTIPPGLRFSDRAGMLTGTPSVGGSSFLQFNVTDSALGSGTAFINLSVLGFTSTVLPAGSVGTPYFTTPGAGGGSGSYTFQFSCLPAGLSDDGMGDITGMPTQGGAFSVCATVNDIGAGISAAQNLALTIASQTITFGPLSSQTFGTAPFTVSATASSGLTVGFASTTMAVCTVSGTTVTLAGVGTCTIQATQSGNTTVTAAIPVNQSFQVTQENQTVTFSPLPSQVFGTAPFTVSATASSTLTVSFASTTISVCSVSGTTVTLAAGGMCTIQATQNGNTYFAAATPINRNFQVTQEKQTITFGPLSGQPIGTAPFTVSATASSGLTPGFASTTTAVCTVSGTTITLVAPGTCTIQATQAGNASYAAASSVNQNFQVTEENQTIAFGPLSSRAFGTAPFTVGATASSGLTPGFASTTTGVCTVSGTTVTLITAGTCTIQATQAGNANYTAASPVNRSFQVTQESQTITFGPLYSQSYGAAPFTVSASATSNLAVNFAAAGPCSISSGTLQITGAGSCVVTASQAGNANYSAATPVSQSLTIDKAVLTVAAGSATMIAGAALPALTSSFTGFVNGDSIAVIGGAPGLTTTATPAAAAGAYAITVTAGTLAAANYSFAFVNGTLTIVANIGIANGAAFGGGIAAPNTILALFGSALGCPQNPQVLVNGVSAQVLFANATQINFVVPGATTGDSASVQVICNGNTIGSTTMTAALVDPAIFTDTGTGIGAGAIVNVNGTLNTPENPIAPGSFISVYVTGFGSFNPPSPDGLQRLTYPVTATIGGVVANVTYAGEAPGQTAGLQQINIQIPSGAPAGANVPLALTVNGVGTQAGITVAIQ